MPAPVLQFKRGNAGVAGTVPALRPGEPAISLNNFDFFIGVDTSVVNNKFFGSHRYWGREDGTNSLRFKLVDKDGTNYISLKSPDTLSGIVTYTLPGTQGGNSTVLTNDGNGNLSWSSGSLNPVFTGIATFTDTTDNTLGNPDTGAVQIDGGVGINKNLTVGTGISVSGESHFIGTATFYGGTINLGDNPGDDIIINGEIGSNLIPTTDATYNLGSGAKRWGQINVSGAATVGSLVCNDGSLFTGSVQINNNLNVNGNITLGGTSHYHASDEILIYSKDIILGVTTNIALYPDTATDITASHGGIAIASTEGTPLVSLYAVGIGTLPDTYKQLMWVRSGTWAGLSTDAWMFNYGVGIGSTQIPAGVRLAVGGVQVTDDTVTATTGNFTNLSGNLTGTISTATRAITVDVAENDTDTGSILFAVGTGSTSLLRDDQLTFNASTNTLTVGTGVGVTQFSSSVSTGTSTSSVPTSSAVIDYVTQGIGGIDLTLGIDADTGGPSTVNTGETLIIAGTTNEIRTSVSGQTITVGFTTDVTVSNNLTVQGNLYVNGSTTQVNTNTLTVEDRTIELGTIQAGQPTTTTWDLAVLFNYGDGTAKKAGVVWEASGGTKRFQFTTDVNTGSDGGPTDTNLPAFTVANFAPIEISELWVNNTCTGGAQQVIGCVGSELQLQNIVIDAGSF